eukprot:2807394-Pyramimonas_sp.AAC.2
MRLSPERASKGVRQIRRGRRNRSRLLALQAVLRVAMLHAAYPMVARHVGMRSVIWHLGII